jgi:UDP-N-acetylglucosamine 2-epimerase
MDNMMKIVSVAGSHPQFVKLAPVAAAFSASDHEHMIVHTGQHYDVEMSDVFFLGLGIPDPDVYLGVGSGSPGVQTGAMLASLDSVLDEHRPDWVLVYGDTNSTLAGAISAVKLHLPVAHLEAGSRSFNRQMPEEHNRVLTDHAADLLLAPTRIAMEHLANEFHVQRFKQRPSGRDAGGRWNVLTPDVNRVSDVSARRGPTGDGGAPRRRIRRTPVMSVLVERNRLARV